MIRIVNLRNVQLHAGEKLIKVDRSTPVGNPFPMHNQSEAERNRVCDEYAVYFKQKVTEKTDTQFMEYLRDIYRAAKKQDIALGCWCAPKRCHAETIKAFLDSFK